MTTLYMLIGVPGSGKSTWVTDLLLKSDTALRVLSTDEYIQYHADIVGKTYDEVFTDMIRPAEKHMYAQLALAIKNNDDIIWDQTNLSFKIRSKKLKRIPTYYRRVAVVFETPEPEEHARRLNSRPGKSIPPAMIAGMIKAMEPPIAVEGWDSIITI